MVERHREIKILTGLLSRHPVVALLGARQVGKTTLAAAVAEKRRGAVTRFDLENPADLAKLADPLLALQSLRGLVIIDEIQLRPNLFSVLRVLADRPRRPATFLILGSAAPELLRQSAESLAGRIAFHELDGFAMDEIGAEHMDRLWLRGRFPKSYLAKSNAASAEWRRAFVRTFLERDLPQLGVGVSATTMRRFWTMLAHYHGQTWNASELGRAFGVADTTVRSYLDTLTAALVVRQLQPWHENLAKRQVKAPKIYVRDSGLVHALLNIQTREDLESHPKVGASWEGFVLHEVMRRTEAHPDECWFWATHAGAELDLLVVRGNKRYGFEFKRTSEPRLTRSMHSAINDLALRRLDVIHAGPESFPLGENVRAVAAARLNMDVMPLK